MSEEFEPRSTTQKQTKVARKVKFTLVKKGRVKTGRSGEQDNKPDNGQIGSQTKGQTGRSGKAEEKCWRAEQHGSTFCK